MSTETPRVNIKKNLIVQKYGGATLSDSNKIKKIAKRISELHKEGSQVVVVVSAMGDTTNQLIELAHQVSERPSLRELDMLLTAGERISMSLLSIALNDLGCPAISFTGSQAGILTDDSHINANIIAVKAFRVEQSLQENKVVILAGFQGVAQNTKEITTLGRGGTDISAVAMADYLHAQRCEILKDVPSVFSADPKLIKTAQPLPQLNFQHLLEMTTWGAKVLNYRSVKLAADKKINLFVGSAEFNADVKNKGTLITSDFSFKESFVLAINSFAQVYELNFSNEEKEFNSNPDQLKIEFNSYLQKNQIGQLQYLYSSQNNNKYYYTAPSEILSSLHKFSTQQNFYKVTNSALASVSVTFSLIATDYDLTELTNLLVQKNIEIMSSFKYGHSLHFFINQEQKIKAIQIFHNLIKTIS